MLEVRNKGSPRKWRPQGAYGRVRKKPKPEGGGDGQE